MDLTVLVQIVVQIHKRTSKYFDGSIFFQRESTLDALQSTIQEGERLILDLNNLGVTQEMDSTGMDR